MTAFDSIAGSDEIEMTNRDPRYDILFEPVTIGPHTAKNRFYQVPHCTGMGWQRPRMLASMRGVKAEGGWGVVCTEYCSVHPSVDDLPYPTQSLWDKGDIKANRLMTDKVHEHGALAGVELWLGGSRSPNLFTREIPLDVVSLPNWNSDPVQSRKMDRKDIREVRRWHRNAALRARDAGFDIVYVYATHQYLLDNFMNRTLNTRTDEYGGSIENRVRLVREIIEDTKDAVGDTMAIAVRFSVDEPGGRHGEPVLGDKMAMFETLAELPDLWDINVDDYSLEMGVSRFVQEGSLENYVQHVKSKTSKPVVSVGRFTSPDAMASQIKRGVVDFIGAARPSISDPFLPSKIEQGRIDDIRECIGCNICYTGTHLGHPIRCTQNPAMGMEWRRGWHPERVPSINTDNNVLVIGAGPAGLEAALTAGKRGFTVALAEASHELGGRVRKESKLPGLNEWARVADYRVQQLSQMANVDIYLDSELSAEQVIEFGYQHVIVATGAHWRDNGIGRNNANPVFDSNKKGLISVNAVLDDKLPALPAASDVVIVDDDDYYMATVIALNMRRAGHRVTLVCSKGTAAHWSQYTEELFLVNRELIDEGVTILTNNYISQFADGKARFNCVFSDKETTLECDALIPVSSREPMEQLYTQLSDMQDKWASNGILSVQSAGDCGAPGIIAQAVHSGREVAMKLESDAIELDAREFLPS